MSCELCSGTGGELLWEGTFCRVVYVEEAGYPGFCRVVWNAHVKEMTDLSEAERIHLMEVVFAVESVLREQLEPAKMNLASLGASCGKRTSYSCGGSSPASVLIRS